MILRLSREKLYIARIAKTEQNIYFFLLAAILLCSADNLCKQFGSSSLSRPKPFDTLKVLLKDFLVKKVSRRQQKHENYLVCKKSKR